MDTLTPGVAVPDPEQAPYDDQGGMTRTGLFKLLAGSAAGAAGITLLVDSGAQAAAPTPGTKQTDLTILAYALTLEYLGVAFYESALTHAHLSGEAHEIALAFRGHERAHVTFVSKTIRSLGGTPHAAETFAFGSATQSKQAFLTTSAKIEEMYHPDRYAETAAASLSSKGME